MEEKLAEYRAQKSKEYQARKTSNGDNVIQKGWQFLNSWRKEPVSIFQKESEANYITAQKQFGPNLVTRMPWKLGTEKHSHTPKQNF